MTKEIENLINQKKYEEAIKLCNKEIEKYTDNYKLYYDRGTIYTCWGKFKKAIIDFNKAISLLDNSNVPNIKKEYARIYFNRSSCYFRLEEDENALADINKAIEFGENNTYSFHNRGIIYFVMEKYDRALNDFNKALSMDNNNYYIYYNRALCYFYLQKYKKSISDFNQYIQFNKNNNIFIPTYLLLNELILKDYKDSIIFNKIIEYDFKLLNSDNIKTKSLFHYRNISKYTIYNILNNKIWFGDVKEFNDPVDPYLKINPLYNNILDRIKVVCLTTNNDNTLMWSHYADKHQGICIEYDITSIFSRRNFILKKINYNKIFKNYDVKNYLLFNSIKTSDNKNIDYAIDAFTVKSKDWEYEDEYRILFYDEKNENPNGTLINLPIKSICFGVKTSDDDKELIYNIVNSINEKRLDYNNDIIKLYQAELDDNELFKINIKPYEHNKNN